jgi:hypothetical protein
MAVALSNLINIFATPTDVFANLKERPRWVIAFVVVSLISIAVGWFMFPFLNQITYKTLSTRLSEQQLQQALAFSRGFEYIGLIFVPIFLLIRWTFVATLLYFLCVLLEAPPAFKYRAVFSAVAYSEMVLLFMSILNVLILYAKGIGSVHHITDLQAIVGVDFFIKNKMSDLPLFILLNSINIFTIWYLATLTIGISIITGCRKLKSALVVTGVWLLGIALQMVMSAISSSSPFHVGI